MRSKLCKCELTHARVEPKRHSFKYPLYMYALDLDELPMLDKELWAFGYNRLRPATINDSDYLMPGAEPIRQKVEELLDSKGCPKPSRIVLVTAARYFGYVFNPASFFFCYNEQGVLTHFVVQVRNTFSQMHAYVLTQKQEAESPYLARFKAPKSFHVSPFFPRTGEYEFLVADLDERLEVVIRYSIDSQRVLTVRLMGDLEPLVNSRLFNTMIQKPFTPALTFPRILRQAFSLFFGKRLNVFRRPVVGNPMTLRNAAPGPIEKLAQKKVTNYLGSIEKGRLMLELPDGSVSEKGDSKLTSPLSFKVRDPRFFPRVLLSGDIGFGESYVDGEWDTDDLTGLLILLLENWDQIDDRNILTANIGKGVNLIRHFARRNTIFNSRKNIREHYDLSNDFYKLFLDRSMTYSSGVYESPQTTLEEAQKNKIRILLEKARVGAGDHILEIGCGWGSTAIIAAREFGCKVTGITLSKEQLAFANERIRQEGLESQIEFRLVDYRKVEGKFDRIISIEMLEAVGHEYLGAFFSTCDRLLAPNGLVVLQVITIPDQRYNYYRMSSDWIRKYIFPGGHLPSLTAMSQAMTRSSSFVVEELDNIGLHYARTLEDWRVELEGNRAKALELGFDERFLRKWEYYFCYCEAGFATRMLNTLQMVLTRPGNSSLPTIHYKDNNL